MLKRLLYRASQSKEKRDDDKEIIMKKRIETFQKSLPIFQVFEDAGNIRKIHAEGTIGEIFNKVETTFH
jgi:adenylate kinase family enzyme